MASELEDAIAKTAAMDPSKPMPIWAQRAGVAAARRVTNLQKLVNEQAEDEGLWFHAITAPETYLQQELRRLHVAIEGLAALGITTTEDDDGSN